MKLFAPALELTLIESHNKKAAFPKGGGTGTLGVEGLHVFAGRAEQWHKTADLVTLRAVEQFESALPVAAKLVAEGGRLGLLIGDGQVPTAQAVLGKNWEWEEPVRIPQSGMRVVVAGRRASKTV